MVDKKKFKITKEDMRSEKIKRRAEYIKLRSESKESNEREYDYEGEMAKTQLRGIIRNANDLINMLEDNTNMAEWVQNKITKACDYIDTARDYMMNDVSEAIMVGQVKSRGPRKIDPLKSKSSVLKTNDMIRQKGSQGRHRQYKGTTSTQSLKQRAANKDRAQIGSNRAYGKGKFSLNKVL